MISHGGKNTPAVLQRLYLSERTIHSFSPHNGFLRQPPVHFVVREESRVVHVQKLCTELLCAYSFFRGVLHVNVVISWGRCVTMFHRSSVLLLAAVRSCDIIGDVADASLLPSPGGMDWRLLLLLLSSVNDDE